MTGDIATVAITGASALAGALMGVGGGGWWLATKFNRVYERMATDKAELVERLNDHEQDDLRVHGELRLQIASAFTQAQVTTGLKPHGR